MADRLGDYGNQIFDRRVPATGIERQQGPVQFPVTSPPKPATLDDVRKELAAQNLSLRPNMRAAVVTSAGITLDWSNVGVMERIMIRNKGPNSVWISFDIEGKAVIAAVSDLSWELQSQEALSIPRCLFQKIGCKCAGIQGGTVHAIAFQNSGRDYAGAVS